MSTLQNDINDFLTYRSYRAQRLNSPDVEPERWAAIFPDWQEYEAEYQRERAEYIETVMGKLDSWIVERGANC